MRFTLVVTSHGRWEYLSRTLSALWDAVPGGVDFFDRVIVSVDHTGTTDDGPMSLPHICGPTGGFYFTGARKGLTANMTQAISHLTDRCEYVFWLEEDFVLHDAPLEEMAKTLDAFPNVANMVLLRQPWGAHEIRAGSVLKAQPYELTDRGGWLEHTGGFWLNPFVAHASLLRSLRPGVERELTAQCRARGLSFGYWGGADDPPRCTHIGAEGGMGSPGWRS